MQIFITVNCSKTGKIHLAGDKLVVGTKQNYEISKKIHIFHLKHTEIRFSFF